MTKYNIIDKFCQYKNIIRQKKFLYKLNSWLLKIKKQIKLMEVIVICKRKKCVTATKYQYL